jgi:hypothetical protein
LEAFLIDQKMAFNTLIQFRTLQNYPSKPFGARIFDTNEIERWFLKVENDLQSILENPTIELSFTKNGDEVLIIQKIKTYLSLLIRFLQVSRLFLISMQTYWYAHNFKIFHLKNYVV